MESVSIVRHSHCVIYTVRSAGALLATRLNKGHFLWSPQIIGLDRFSPYVSHRSSAVALNYQEEKTSWHNN
jgi:hypothetical protein